jgi:hypothetical protein
VSWIIGGNRQDHGQGQIFIFPVIHFGHNIGWHTDMIVSMEYGWIKNHEGQPRFIDRLEPFKRSLRVMIENDVPLGIRKSQQTGWKSDNAVVGDIK